MRRSRGQGICPLSSSPPQGICQFFLKNANARGLARGGGGWALLELTDALLTAQCCRGRPC